MIRFRVFQPLLLKNSKDIVSKHPQPFFKMLLSSSLDKMDQLLTQKTHLNITCKIDTNFDLWNTISFLLSRAIKPNRRMPHRSKLGPSDF
jgi:hypothetical protein